MSDEEATESVPTMIILLIVIVLFLFLFWVIFSVKTGSRTISLLGNVLVNLLGYGGVFKGLVVEAFKGLGSATNF